MAQCPPRATTTVRSRTLLYRSSLSLSLPVSTLVLQDRWINMSRGDAALVSLGNKLDPMPGQWSNTAISQGSSTLSSGNNLMSTSRWSQSPSQPHMLTNGMYMPYSTTSTIDDGSRQWQSNSRRESSLCLFLSLSFFYLVLLLLRPW